MEERTEETSSDVPFLLGKARARAHTQNIALKNIKHFWIISQATSNLCKQLIQRKYTYISL